MTVSSTAIYLYQVHGWVAELYVNCLPWYVSDGCAGRADGQLRCPTASEVSKFDAAVRRGEIVYAASPFNIDPEVVRLAVVLVAPAPCILSRASSAALPLPERSTLPAGRCRWQTRCFSKTL